MLLGNLLPVMKSESYILYDKSFATEAIQQCAHLIKVDDIWIDPISKMSLHFLKKLLVDFIKVMKETQS